MSSQSWLSPDVESGSAKQQDSNWQEDPATGATGATSTAPAASSTANGNDKKKGKCTFWFNLFIGTVLAILFIIAASLQWNDKDRDIMWGIFYVVQAILAIVGTMRMCFCKRMLTKPIMFICGAMLIWSIVLLVVASVDLSKTSKGGDTEGGDANNRTQRQEIGYELGGAILGCLSCIYFFCMCMCCDKAPSNDE